MGNNYFVDGRGYVAEEVYHAHNKRKVAKLGATGHPVIPVCREFWGKHRVIRGNIEGFLVMAAYHAVSTHGTPDEAAWTVDTTGLTRRLIQMAAKGARDAWATYLHYKHSGSGNAPAIKAESQALYKLTEALEALLTL